MIENIQSIYENSVLHPLKPLNLPENKILEIDVRDVLETDTSINTKKIKAFEEWMESLDPNAPNLTDEQISRESIYENKCECFLIKVLS